MKLSVTVGGRTLINFQLQPNQVRLDTAVSPVSHVITSLRRGKRERSPQHKKLCVRVTHIWGNRRGQPSQCAMARPHPRGTALMITVRPPRQVSMPFARSLPDPVESNCLNRLLRTPKGMCMHDADFLDALFLRCRKRDKKLSEPLLAKSGPS